MPTVSHTTSKQGKALSSLFPLPSCLVLSDFAVMKKNIKKKKKKKEEEEEEEEEAGADVSDDTKRFCLLCC